ncbi:TIGR04255 family protein [Burkholderia cepacia]|uniref:TIGR04255 family protein n=1 Tax=Burkholderia cepacia TaxID=292 RepID=UPI001628A796|nr:TIGR04255 family protein [Burkholderia cepacia]
MSTSRENAPLVELVAELRWESAIAIKPPVIGGAGPAFVATNTSALDGFFMRFGGAASNLSYTESERLIPVGFPILAHQAVYRFKHNESGETRSLYQIGSGLFSANAIPPYKSWTSFEPVVRNGVEALLKSRDPSEASQPFTAVSLRYIDAFGPQHTEGRDVMRFLTEVLGIGITVPPALSRHLRADTPIKPVLQLQIPMAEGMVMSVAIGEGVANGQQALMMDTSVATTLPVPANLEVVMGLFKRAHDTISESFTQLVKPIDHVMPVKAE